MTTTCCSGRCWIVSGTVFGFLSVFAGAFGAHGLKDTGWLVDKHGAETRDISGLSVPASYKYLGDFEIGVRYQMYHALALIALGLFAERSPSRATHIAGCCLGAGTILFSGSLYLIVLADPKWLGVPWGLIAAVGGTTQLVGWAAFAFAAATGKRQSSLPEEGTA